MKSNEVHSTSTELSCDVPRPLARMNWTRRGGASLPVSAKMVDYGRRLVLTNISFDDEGFYTCTAANEIGVTKSSISLTVVGKLFSIFFSKY